MSNLPDDELLDGGNVSKVWRSGNTVRREIKSNSERIHALLKHLEKRGYEYSPRYIGIDKENREILSFIEGVAGNYPLKKYMWTDDVIQEIAKMLRHYHDCASDFEFDESWTSIDNTPENVEVICHNDFAFYNIIFQNERPIAVIDFDVAAPGPRLWDIAYTLYTCVPLSRFIVNQTGEKEYYCASQDSYRIKNRVKLFFDSYGEKIPSNLIDMILLRLDGLCKTITRKASEGDQAFQKMIDEGHLEHYQKDIAFISKHGNDWV